MSTHRTLVMGVLNVTPDSFSDGGDFLDPVAAVARGQLLLDEGADIIDVGGESTRPGAVRPSPDEEAARVLPVIHSLAERGAVVSVDTMRAEVAEAAVHAGATIVNDVSGGLADPAMLATVASLDARYIAMHWRGHSDTMESRAVYTDLVGEVVGELAARVDAARAAGIGAERLIVDPGFGFAKDAGHNWELLRHLEAISALGYPVLIAVSRKRFLGSLLSREGVPRPPQQRDAASAALTLWAAQHGAWAVRTHTVREHRDAIAVWNRLGVAPARTGGSVASGGEAHAVPK